LDQAALTKKAKTHHSTGKIVGRGIKKGSRLLLNKEKNVANGIRKQSLLLVNNTDMLVNIFFLKLTFLIFLS
jgi:hypothetical protein